eukprot:scaffold1375_cov137-Cylindrotheca_fusiformis.AAC.3
MPGKTVSVDSLPRLGTGSNTWETNRSVVGRSKCQKRRQNEATIFCSKELGLYLCAIKPGYEKGDMVLRSSSR